MCVQEDLVLLESLDRPLMAYCLRHRYQEDKIYTWVGADHTVLIVSIAIVSKLASEPTTQC